MANILWNLLDVAPAHWDPAEHLKLSFDFTDYFTGGNPEAFLKVSPFYPPLLHIVFGFISFFLGKSADLIFVLMNIYLVLFIVIIYFFLQELGTSKRASLVSCLLILLIPSTQMFSRQFWLEIPFGLFLFGSWLAMLRSKQFTDRKFTILFSLGIAAVQLTRLTGFIYLVIPIGWYFFGQMNFRSVQAWARLSLAMIPAILITLPWYLTNLDGIIRFAQFFGYYEPFEPSIRFSLENLTYNFYLIANYLLTFIPTTLALFGVFVARRKTTKNFWLFASYLSFLYFAFTFILNKDVKYIYPMVPFLCLFAAYTLLSLWDKVKWYRRSVAIIPIALMLVFATSYGFGTPFDPDNSEIHSQIELPVLGVIDLVKISKDSFWITPKYNSTEWPLVEILVDIDPLCRQSERQLKLLTLVNKLNFNPINLDYTLKSALDSRCPEINFPGGMTKPLSEYDSIHYLESFDIVLIPQNDFGSDIMPELEAVKYLKLLVENEQTKFKLLNTFKLPDGDLANLYAKELQ